MPGRWIPPSASCPLIPTASALRPVSGSRDKVEGRKSEHLNCNIFHDCVAHAEPRRACRLRRVTVSSCGIPPRGLHACMYNAFEIGSSARLLSQGRSLAPMAWVEASGCSSTRRGGACGTANQRAGARHPSRSLSTGCWGSGKEWAPPPMHLTPPNKGRRFAPLCGAVSDVHESIHCRRASLFDVSDAILVGT